MGRSLHSENALWNCTLELHSEVLEVPGVLVLTKLCVVDVRSSSASGTRTPSTSTPSTSTPRTSTPSTSTLSTSTLSTPSTGTFSTFSTLQHPQHR